MSVGRTLSLLALALACLLSAPAQHRHKSNSKSTFSGEPRPNLVQVPFVGCPADGQTGPVDPPALTHRGVDVPAALVDRLAYYKSAYGFGVLAPRGWHCASVYGSNGSTLYLSPNPLTPADVLASTWKGFSGPAIQISTINGNTSGRFEAARLIARVFPSQRSFVEHVISEHLAPASDFVFGPFPTDKISPKYGQVVEYSTPAHAEGLGTLSHLHPNDQPIQGVVLLASSAGSAPDVVHLALRLPAELSDLLQPILHQTDYDGWHQPR